jgi:hypothetical protein
MHWRLVLGVLLTGCATATLVGPPPEMTPRFSAPQTVLLEPFFEAADWQVSRRTEYVTNQPDLGGWSLSGYNTSAPTTRIVEVAEKPYLARPDTLAALHQATLIAVQHLRPSWAVVSSRAGNALRGRVAVVRTVIGNSVPIESDRGIKNLALGFGLVLWPLLILAAQPIDETLRIYGFLERADLQATELPGRLVKYDTQPDAAVNLAGIPLERQGFGLDISLKEGLLADETARRALLVSVLAQRLALAIVTMADTGPPPAPPVQ